MNQPIPFHPPLLQGFHISRCKLHVWPISCHIRTAVSWARCEVVLTRSCCAASRYPDRTLLSLPEDIPQRLIASADWLSRAVFQFPMVRQGSGRLRRVWERERTKKHLTGWVSFLLTQTAVGNRLRNNTPHQAERPSLWSLLLSVLKVAHYSVQSVVPNSPTAESRNEAKYGDVKYFLRADNCIADQEVTSLSRYQRFSSSFTSARHRILL